ncbi:stage III sporulation protein AD [Clostridium tertium]|uniref:stage III sporulation protein AD n=1 Tax=Clostridium tertium TaxID=1559 RepID=UPI00232BA232|nr:stage III sporulation protein AD [Clostridium tertium]MDB1956285.1 stage III sporulation protein AD [Clostridium tertium]MDB1959568.1 stage III sporulation protein AD [Clostridium tertium]MDB1963473.1 stage III sporulation protein AD [Clostridium tertium]MDB1967355.1 stage III sporulation protein AD [Clostridium tertium]
MDIIKIVAFAFAALFMFLLFKDKRSDISTLISLSAGAIIFLVVITQLNDVIYFIKDIAYKANIDMVYIGVVLKILAIAYLATFCSEICKDAGAASIASKVEFSAKILILTLAIPILMAVLQSILQIL